MGSQDTLHRLSIIIPARNEEACIALTVRNLHETLKREDIGHEIIVVDDRSEDDTWQVLEKLSFEIPELKNILNEGENGFGRAVSFGLKSFSGDAAVIMMADDSDDSEDVVTYWRLLNEGHDCVFGSRFIKGSKLTDYPRFKLVINRIANYLIRVAFNIRLNDTTNAFKAYRREVIEGCGPILSPHFNLTVELPLKAIVRGYSWTVVPISWRNRQNGTAKLKIKEMGSRYFFICAYVWLEKFFSKGDYYRRD